jgi:hypothetical protein
MSDDERIDLDKLLDHAMRADEEDPSCWFYPWQSVDPETLAEMVFISAASPRVVISLIRRILEVEAALVDSCSRGEVMASQLEVHGMEMPMCRAAYEGWRELVKRGTTR